MAGHRSSLWVPVPKQTNQNQDDQSVPLKDFNHVDSLIFPINVNEKLALLKTKVIEKIEKKYHCKIDPNDIEAKFHIDSWQKERNNPASVVVPIVLSFQFCGCPQNKRLQYNGFEDFFSNPKQKNYLKPTSYSMPDRGRVYAFTDVDDIIRFSKSFDVILSKNDLNPEDHFCLTM